MSLQRRKYKVCDLPLIPRDRVLRTLSLKRKERKEKKRKFGPNVFGSFVGWVGGFFPSRRGVRIAERGVGTSAAAASGRSTRSINSPVASQ